MPGENSVEGPLSKGSDQFVLRDGGRGSATAGMRIAFLGGIAEVGRLEPARARVVANGRIPLNRRKEPP